MKLLVTVKNNYEFNPTIIPEWFYRITPEHGRWSVIGEKDYKHKNAALKAAKKCVDELCESVCSAEIVYVDSKRQSQASQDK